MRSESAQSSASPIARQRAGARRTATIVAWVAAAIYLAFLLRGVLGA